MPGETLTDLDQDDWLKNLEYQFFNNFMPPPIQTKVELDLDLESLQLALRDANLALAEAHQNVANLQRQNEVVSESLKESLKYSEESFIKMMEAETCQFWADQKAEQLEETNLEASLEIENLREELKSLKIAHNVNLSDLRLRAQNLKDKKSVYKAEVEFLRKALADKEREFEEIAAEKEKLGAKVEELTKLFEDEYDKVTDYEGFGVWESYSDGERDE